MITPAIVVAVLDSSGQVVPGATDTVTLALSGGASGVTLRGTTTVAAHAGLARFTDLSIDHPGGGYALSASAVGLHSATSNAFTVSAADTTIEPPRAKTLVATATSTCVLDQSGAVWCWGDDVVGQLGTGRIVSNPTPIRMAAPAVFSSISVSKSTGTSENGRHGGDYDGTNNIACALSTSGVAYCWGGGAYPFSDGDRSPRTKNAAMPAPVAEHLRFSSISVGHLHACGLADDGTAWCWGSVPADWGHHATMQVGGALRFRTLVTGFDHTCGLDAAGKAYCWGVSAAGELGHGQQVGSATPVAVIGGHTFQRLALGSMHTCGLTDGGEVWCWYQNPGVPTRVSEDIHFVSVGAGAHHTCALDAVGAAWCWGDNRKGQLGDGTTTRRDAPVPVRGGLRFTSISGGGAHTCGLTALGEAWCWGWSNDGQVGDGRWKDRSEPVRVLGDKRFVEISAGGDATCGLTADGTGWCWGDNYGGELGDGHPLYSPAPVRVSGGLTFASLAGGGNGICALTQTGATWCWGTIGDSVGNRSVPVPLSGDRGFTMVSSSGFSGCGIDQERKAWCWGYGRGDGILGSSGTPTLVPGGLSFSMINVGSYTCGLTLEGDAYCWGGYIHALRKSISTPTLMSGGLKFVTVAGQWDHDCGITATGRLYCWGENTYGELGDGTRTHRETPVPILSHLRFTTVSANNGRTCAVTKQGDAYCWGAEFNNDGSATPKLLPGGLKFAAISLSNSWGAHACGITTSGAIYCWGSNRWGQLGNGSIDLYSETAVPTLVVGELIAEFHARR